jgi:MurNAc alpha-1-phosphate uridylyltransferase
MALAMSALSWGDAVRDEVSVEARAAAMRDPWARAKTGDFTGPIIGRHEPTTAPAPERAMKAILLAAGRGERMRPLSDTCPKPLLAVRGRTLLEWHLLALARAGVRDIVINTAWLEERIVEALGDGARLGVSIRYSLEGRDHGGALETAGGIATALPLLADRPDDCFWVVSGDVYTPDFAYDAATAAAFAAGDALAHVWLVPNPPYHPAGDFGLDAHGRALDGPGPDGKRWTYANLALCRASLFDGIAPGRKAKLGPLLYEGMRQGRITGEMLPGTWENVGTPEQLAALNR